MGYNKACSASHKIQYGFLNQDLGSCVHTACCFIKNENRRICQDYPGNSQKLLLSFRNVGGVLIDHGLIAFRKSHDKVMSLGCLCCLHNLIESSPLTSVRYVVTDSAVKQPCILENHTKDRTQVPAGKLSDVNTVNCYPSAIYFVEPHEQVHKGGLACSCRAYNSDCLSRFHIYVHILNERNILLITETHAVECHFSPGSLYDFSVLFVRHLFRFIKEFKDAFCRCDSRLYDIGDIRS